uniref:Putative secreted protein n=1 Tax=Anopheles triannulatus TaxID=58253 RepID=A0A2M4B3E5_9DIPT
MLLLLLLLPLPLAHDLDFLLVEFVFGRCRFSCTGHHTPRWIHRWDLSHRDVVSFWRYANHSHSKLHSR